MPYNGSGVFTRVHDFETDRDGGIKILASRMDAEFNGVATGLSNCLLKDGQQTVTANIPFAGFRLTGVGAGTASTDAANLGQVQAGAFTYASETGSADAYAIGPSPAITAYAAGQRFMFVAGNTNTGASTLNVSALGTKAIQKLGSALVAGDITANDLVSVVYDGTQFQMISPARTPVLTAGSIAAAALASSAVEEAKIAANAVTNGKLAAALQTGTQTISIPARAWTAEATNGAEHEVITATGIDLAVYSFDGSADEAIQIAIEMPAAWDLGTLTYKIHWTSSATDTDGVKWFLEAVAVQDSDDLDGESFGTAIGVADNAISSANDLYTSAVSAALTVGGTPANGNLVIFRLYRDVSDASDTMAEDAHFIDLTLYYTADQHNDD